MRSISKKVEIKQRIQADINLNYKIFVDKSTEYDEKDRKIGQFEVQIQEKEREYRILDDSGIIKRLISLKRRRDIERQIATLKIERDTLKTQQPRFIRAIAEQQMKWQGLQKKFDEYEAATRGAELDDLYKMTKAISDEIEILKRRINDLEKSMEDTIGYVISNALVIFTTLSKAHLDRDLGGVSFDRVIIDEASMASLPQVFLAGFKAKKSIYIFGDDKQLAPICTSDKDTVRKWFARDIYQYANL